MGRISLRSRYMRAANVFLNKFKNWPEKLGQFETNEREKMNMIAIPINETIEQPKQSVLPLDVLDSLIDKAAAQAIATKCQCRDGRKCNDYDIHSGCLMLGSTVKDVHPKLGRQVTKDEAKEYMRTSIASGLYPLISHYYRDAQLMDLDFEKMLIICVCCPCCCVARTVAPLCEDVENSFYQNFYGLPDVHVSFDKEICTDCKKCIKTCPGNAIISNENGIEFLEEKCKGCGVCADVCPSKSFSVSFGAKSVEDVLNSVKIHADIS